MIHAQVEERHGTSLHVLSFHSPIKQKCSIIGPLKLNPWMGNLKALFNFIKVAWKAKKSLKQPGCRLLKGLRNKTTF